MVEKNCKHRSSTHTRMHWSDSQRNTHLIYSTGTSFFSSFFSSFFFLLQFIFNSLLLLLSGHYLAAFVRLHGDNGIITIPLSVFSHQRKCKWNNTAWIFVGQVATLRKKKVWIYIISRAKNGRWDRTAQQYLCVCVCEGNAHAQTKARAELEYFTLKQNKNVFHAKISQR